MSEIHFPKSTPDIARRRHELAPAMDDAFKAFSQAVFADGALDKRTKQLIAVAVAPVTQSPLGIEGHRKGARPPRARDAQIMGAVLGAAEMRAGAAFAHSIKSLDLLGPAQGQGQGQEGG